MIISRLDDSFYCLEEVNVASLEDVKNGTIPKLTYGKFLKPIAAQMSEDHNCYYVQMEDLSIHVISIMQFYALGIEENLPKITEQKE